PLSVMYQLNCVLLTQVIDFVITRVEEGTEIQIEVDVILNRQHGTAHVVACIYQASRCAGGTAGQRYTREAGAGRVSVERIDGAACRLVVRAEDTQVEVACPNRRSQCSGVVEAAEEGKEIIQALAHVVGHDFSIGDHVQNTRRRCELQRAAGAAKEYVGKA